MLDSVKKLNVVPNANHFHHWADWAELLCLTDPDGAISRSDMSEKVKEARDLGGASADSMEDDESTAMAVDSMTYLSVVPAQVEGDARSDELESAFETLDTLASNDEVADAEVDDYFNAIAEEVWRRLFWREKTFGETWPFRIEEGVLTRLKMTSPRVNYVNVLMCASLHRFSKSDGSRLAAAFERLGALALKAAYPTPWEVHLFGTTAASGSRYSQPHLHERLKRLSRDIRCRLVTSRAEDYAAVDVGDGGLDIVAYLPMAGNARGIPLAFAQCASGATNWRRKQAEASFDSWATTFHFTSPPVTWTFVPFVFHSPSSREWERRGHVAFGVLVDRVRLLGLLREDVGAPFEEFPVMVASAWLESA